MYGNRMINVGVLNNKLFFRSLDLIKMFSGANDAVGMQPVCAFSRSFELVRWE